MINVYTVPNCPQCTFTKRALDKGSVPYSEIDGRDHVDTLREKGFRTFPVVSDAKTGKTWEGFRPDLIKEL